MDPSRNFKKAAAAPGILFFLLGMSVVPPATFHLGSTRAGEAPEHRLTIDVAAGAPQIYNAEVTYPPGFRFNGFDTLGPAGSPVGGYTLDIGADDAPDLVVPIRSLDPRRAFADVSGDGVFNASLEPVLDATGNGRFRLRVPFGGDAIAATLTAPLSVRVGLVLAPGLIVNPSLGGRHVITGWLRSVDPDTGGHDDGQNEAPSQQAFELAVTIDGPRLVPFAWLHVTKFDLDLFRRRDDRFQVHGRLALGRKSNGIDLAGEQVTVIVDGFQQTIDGRSFERAGYGYRYRGVRPGITSLHLHPDGRFEIHADGLHWIEGEGPSWRRRPFSLRIGNDLGETTVSDRRRYGWF